MKIYSVNDKEFAAYGKVHTGYDVSDLLSALDKSTPLPDAVGYVPSEAALENTKLFGLLQNNAYGGMPVQLGWCNGHNTKLNCLEYHRDSEFNIGLYDFVLLVAKEDDIVTQIPDNRLFYEALPSVRLPILVFVSIDGLV